MNSFSRALGERTRGLIAASIVLLALSAIVPADAQGAARPVLTGRVTDAETGKPIPYASIALFREDRPEGAPGSAAGGVVSGEDGSFRMQPPAGFYRAIVTHVAYQTLRVEGIEVREGQTTNVAFKLAASEFKMKAVEVAGEQAKSTEVSVVALQKEARVVSDGVSAELIKKTPDANAADVLRRVSGLSVVDDKYVHIRGVTDRYNVATMDGVKVSSTDTDTDKRSFTFDLVPGSLLSSTVVVKTAAPDLPGDFSGGLVQVNTLDFPSNRILKLSFSPTYAEGVSTREILRSEGGTTDWRAKDDGSREIPGDVTGDDLARALRNTWGVRAKKSPINGSYGISYGDRLSLGRHKFGIISSLNYKQSYGRTDFKQEPTYRGYPVFKFDGTRSSYSVLGAGLLNLAYSPGRGHDFSLRNSIVRNAKEQVSVSEGLPASGEWARRQTIGWDERTLSSTQLAGTHEFRALRKLGLEWKMFRSASNAYEPDRKHVEFERTGNLWALKENYRTWSSLGESSRGASADIRLPFGLSDLKAGVFAETRKRDYEIDAYATDPSYLSPSNYGLLVLPLDSIFLPKNYGPGKFRFVPLVRFTGEYDGKEEVRAYYGMIDHPFTLAWMRFNAAGGLRVERSVLYVQTRGRGRPRARHGPHPVSPELGPDPRRGHSLHADRLVLRRFDLLDHDRARNDHSGRHGRDADHLARRRDSRFRNGVRSDRVHEPEGARKPRARRLGRRHPPRRRALQQGRSADRGGDHRRDVRRLERRARHRRVHLRAHRVRGLSLPAQQRGERPHDGRDRKRERDPSRAGELLLRRRLRVVRRNRRCQLLGGLRHHGR
ncbi:MAG: carboxypeptidase regulatory-like domain-containing protein [Candidatus Eisenbacteria bacterium]|nr:carboxypeptidase regulatory-like domain-containing protein [Candidatus Eisenbacteria bacterium]